MSFFSLQIKHMMAFIEQEANEKAEEIDAKVGNCNLCYLLYIIICYTVVVSHCYISI